MPHLRCIVGGCDPQVRRTAELLASAIIQVPFRDRAPFDARQRTRQNGRVSTARSGYQRSVPGLTGALIAVLVLIAAIWGLSRFQHRDPADPTPSIDYASELAAAQESAPFDVLAPDSLPPGWRATSAAWRPGAGESSWHLGLLTAQGEYVGLEQGNSPPTDFVKTHTPATEPGEPVVVAGQPWETLSASGGREHALVRQDDGVTTVITGTAPMSELEAFAASLTTG